LTDLFFVFIFSRMLVQLTETRRKLKYLTEMEVSALTGIPVRTLQTWRSQKREIPYSKFGGSVRYSLVAVEEYLAAATVPVK
jgi:hypothetical protein